MATGRGKKIHKSGMLRYPNSLTYSKNLVSSYKVDLSNHRGLPSVPQDTIKRDNFCVIRKSLTAAETARRAVILKDDPTGVRPSRGCPKWKVLSLTVNFILFFRLVSLSEGRDRDRWFRVIKYVSSPLTWGKQVKGWIRSSWVVFQCWII